MRLTMFKVDYAHQDSLLSSLSRLLLIFRPLYPTSYTQKNTEPTLQWVRKYEEEKRNNFPGGKKVKAASKHTHNEYVQLKPVFRTH